MTSTSGQGAVKNHPFYKGDTWQCGLNVEPAAFLDEWPLDLDKTYLSCPQQARPVHSYLTQAGPRWLTSSTSLFEQYSSLRKGGQGAGPHVPTSSLQTHQSDTLLGRVGPRMSCSLHEQWRNIPSASSSFGIICNFIIIMYNAVSQKSGI